jgi:hypothetical protein
MLGFLESGESRARRREGFHAKSKPGAKKAAGTTGAVLPGAQRETAHNRKRAGDMLRRKPAKRRERGGFASRRQVKSGAIR